MRARHRVAPLALALVVAAGCGPATIHVTLDGETRYQTIDGWATISRYWEEDKQNDHFDKSFEPHVDEIASFLVNEVGINAIRLEVASGMENTIDYWKRFYAGEIGYREYARHRYEKINDNGDPHIDNPSGFQFDLFDYRVETALLPLKRALEARGERLLINVCYVDFASNAAAGRTVQGGLSHARNPSEFAEFALVYLRRLRNKYGLSPDSFEIILEPENTAEWRGREIGGALVVVADLLRKNGFQIELIAPSNTSMANAITYFDEMVKVPGALERLSTFAYHRYRWQRTSDVEQIWSRARAHELKTAMLETIGAGIDTLLEDLTVGHVSAWQLWGPAARLDGSDSGAVYALVDAGSQTSAPRIALASRSYELSHVFRHVRRGAVRIAAATTPSRHVSAAFINPDGTWVVVVRTRAAAEPLSIDGLPAGRYGVRFTSDDRSRIDHHSVTLPEGGTFSLSTRAAGIVTVYGLGRNGDTR